MRYVFYVYLLFPADYDFTALNLAKEYAVRLTLSANPQGLHVCHEKKFYDLTNFIPGLYVYILQDSIASNSIKLRTREATN